MDISFTCGHTFSSHTFASTIHVLSSHNLFDCIHALLYFNILYYMYKLCEINYLSLLTVDPFHSLDNLKSPSALVAFCRKSKEGCNTDGTREPVYKWEKVANLCAVHTTLLSYSKSQ